MGKLKRLSLTQIKALFYSIIGVISAVVAAVIARLGCGETAMYALCWGILFGGVGVTVCRTALHLYLEDYRNAEMWAVSIAMLAMCGGWLGCILCNSYGWLFFWIAFICFFGIMGIGIRFVKKQEEKVEERTLLEELSATVRYRYKNNDPDAGEDLDNPLCMNQGVALTVDEAFEEGYGALAATGLEYLKAIAKKVEEKTSAEEEEE